MFGYRYKGNTKLEPSERILCERDGDKYTLTLKDTVVKQTGQYTVKANNEMGKLEASAKLKVNGK